MSSAGLIAKHRRTPMLQMALSNRNRLKRAVWRTSWFFLFRPSPSILFGWRRLLLRCFGARLTETSFIYPSTRIWAPWNLEMGANSCLASDVDCYSVDRVYIGQRVTVSQYSFLCTASHDINDPAGPLITAPIRLENDCWVCAAAFVGPGVTVGEGGVVGATASVFRDVEPWTVVGGNPARVISERVRRMG
jgi:putative colanic acid biosynthesis acetyltransferase WcaF